MEVLDPSIPLLPPEIYYNIIDLLLDEDEIIEIYQSCALARNYIQHLGDCPIYLEKLTKIRPSGLEIAIKSKWKIRRYVNAAGLYHGVLSVKTKPPHDRRKETLTQNFYLGLPHGKEVTTSDRSKHETKIMQRFYYFGLLHGPELIEWDSGCPLSREIASYCYGELHGIYASVDEYRVTEGLSFWDMGTEIPLPADLAIAPLFRKTRKPHKFWKRYYDLCDRYAHLFTYPVVRYAFPEEDSDNLIP